MKLFMFFLFSVLTPFFAQAEVHCSMIHSVDCPPSSECINVDAVLGQNPPAVESEDESID